MEKFQFTPDQIWNVDETGIPAVFKPPKVLAPKGTKQVSQTVSAERNVNTTMMCFISAIGNTVSPF